MRYRAEIDGLRAIAVLPVILFHAGFDVFGGGFVGVDVFFVISGYLITSILLSELSQADFSISRFYERRARRILPALFVVVLACFPFAYAWMSPAQLDAFGLSVASVSLFSSNILFWREAGYFDAASEIKPLLHTWSLAVEEQFYLLFPIFLAFIWRFGRKWAFAGVAFAAIGSFAWAHWGGVSDEAKFFLAPTRMWELLAGSIAAFYKPHLDVRSQTVFSTAGLVLILAALVLCDHETPFPNYALAPVLGTVLIIVCADPSTWVARFLAIRPLVSIGLVSYSAYLWHQPVFAFARLRSLDPPSDGLMALLVLVTLALSFLTWRFVERPFRARGDAGHFSRRQVLMTSVLAAVAFCAIGLAAHLGRGFEGRFGPEFQRIAQAETDRAAVTAHCTGDQNRSLAEQPFAGCTWPNAQGAVDVMLIGDSHAWAISQELNAALAQADIGVYAAFYNGCVPIKNLKRFDVFKNSALHKCAEFTADAYAYAAKAGIKTVVLAGRFAQYVHGTAFDNTEGGIEQGGPARAFVDLAARPSSDRDDPERPQRVLAAYEHEIRELARKFAVVLVNPFPDAGWNVPKRTLRLAVLLENWVPLTTPLGAYLIRTQAVRNVFDTLAADLPKVFVVRPDLDLCDAKTRRCVNADADGVYYIDDDHLSNAGARRVVGGLVTAIQKSLGWGHTIEPRPVIGYD